MGKKLELPKYCKSCFKEIKQHSFKSFFQKDSCLCDKCYEKFELKIKRLKIDNCKGVVLYKYNDFFKEKLFMLKGCGDIELSSIFLDKLKFFLHIIYKNFVIVPAPSYIDADEKRGFVHLEEIFKVLNIPIQKVLMKNADVKQSDLNFKERANIKNIIQLNEQSKLRGKKVLFVDDVFTSGSTCKACLNLLKEEKPKKLNFLILSSKTIFKD